MAALSVSTAAHACGACDEDKIAATYDYSVVTRASAQHRVVVFAAVLGRGPAKALASNARQAAISVAGVDRDSVRAAAEPAPAVSFAVDPGRQTPKGALAAMSRSVAGKGIRFTLLKVVS